MHNNRLHLAWIEPGRQHRDNHDTKTVHVLDNGYSVVRLLTKNSLLQEGHTMQHCLQNETDAEHFHKTKVVGGCENYGIYSLRDIKNRPHATMVINTHERILLTCRGKQNRPATQKYHPYLLDFFKTFDIVPQKNAGDTGWFYQNGEFWDITDLPDDFVAEDDFILYGNQYPVTLPRIIHGNLDIRDTGIKDLSHIQFVSGQVITSFGDELDLETSTHLVRFMETALAFQRAAPNKKRTLLKGFPDHWLIQPLTRLDLHS